MQNISTVSVALIYLGWIKTLKNDVSFREKNITVYVHIIMYIIIDIIQNWSRQQQTWRTCWDQW